MKVGQTIKFELVLGRYVDGRMCSIFQENGEEKYRIQYGPTSFCVVRKCHIPALNPVKLFTPPPPKEEENIDS
jgi:hypothetical protein